MISVKISGRFRILDSQGIDLTPRGMKSRGVLAMLSLSPEYSRTRGWLQSHLWSTRSPEQASGSLRQSLSEIRRMLGQENKSLIVTDGVSVSLDSTKFVLERADSSSETLCEDLEINDPAFSKWLLELRDSQKAISAVPSTRSLRSIQCEQQPVIIVEAPIHLPGSVEHNVNTYVKSMIVSMILECTDMNVIDISNQGGVISDEFVKAQDGILLSVSTSKFTKSCTTHVQLRSLSQKRILWMDMCKSTNVGEGLGNEIIPDLRRLISHLISNLYKVIPDLYSSKDQLQFFAPFLFHKAQKELFQLKKDNLIRAYDLLDMAYTNQKNGMYLAWKAYVQNIAQFQYPYDNIFSGKQNVVSLLNKAIDSSPNNSFVNAILAQHEYLDNNNMISANALAQRSIEYNPSNPFSWAILANTQLAVMDLESSKKSVLIANDLAKQSDYRFFIDFFNCMVAAGSDDYKGAVRYAEMARASNRNFIGPLRYLIPLYKHLGQMSKHYEAERELAALEPGFSIARYSDPAYPVNTLRKIPLIKCVT